MKGWELKPVGVNVIVVLLILITYVSYKLLTWRRALNDDSTTG